MDTEIELLRGKREVMTLAGSDDNSPFLDSGFPRPEVKGRQWGSQSLPRALWLLLLLWFKG